MLDEVDTEFIVLLFALFAKLLLLFILLILVTVLILFKLASLEFLFRLEIPPSVVPDCEFLTDESSKLLTLSLPLVNSSMPRLALLYVLEKNN